MNRLILLISGIALIGFGFISLVNINPWPKQIWLDLVVALLVFAMNFANITWVSQSVSKFRARIPSLGILWTFNGLYSLSAIACLFAAHREHWSYSLSLVIQLSLVFGAIVAFSLASRANQYALNVQHSEAISLSSLDQLRSVFASGSPSVLRFCTANPQILQAITSIGDDLRYLSASQGQIVHELEKQLQDELQNLFEIFKSATSSDINPLIPSVQNAIIRIKDLMQKRKAYCNTADSKEMLL